MEETNFAVQLKNFLDETGRLKQYPKKRAPKIMSLFYLASKFEGGKEYSEKEVNEIIQAWHTFRDWPMLRRDLYNGGFLDRHLDGGVYWLKQPQPQWEDFQSWIHGSLS